MNLATELDESALSISIHEEYDDILYEIRDEFEELYDKQFWFVYSYIKKLNTGKDVIVVVVQDETCKCDIILPNFFDGLKVFYRFGQIKPF